MGRRGLGVAFVVACSALGACAHARQNAIAAPPPIHHAPSHHVAHGWPVLPDGEILGAVAGVGVDAHDDVLVFHRAGRTWPASNEVDLTPIARPTSPSRPTDRSTSPTAIATRA